MLIMKVKKTQTLKYKNYAVRVDKLNTKNAKDIFVQEQGIMMVDGVERTYCVLLVIDKTDEEIKKK